MNKEATEQPGERTQEMIGTIKAAIAVLNQPVQLSTVMTGDRAMRALKIIKGDCLTARQLLQSAMAAAERRCAKMQRIEFAHCPDCGFCGEELQERIDHLQQRCDLLDVLCRSWESRIKKYSGPKKPKQFAVGYLEGMKTCLIEAKRVAIAAAEQEQK